jgi:hypothetical protein
LVRILGDPSPDFSVAGLGGVSAWALPLMAGSLLMFRCKGALR